MILPPNISNMGFRLDEIAETDINDFFRINRLCHKGYIDEFNNFFGEWNEDLLINVFHEKMKLLFFYKLFYNDEVVGFLNYDIKEDKIDDISIMITENAQNKGVGSFFLSHLVTLSNKMDLPVFIHVIKSNPAQNLYKRFGFEIYKEEDVFIFLRYKSTNEPI